MCGKKEAREQRKPYQSESMRTMRKRDVGLLMKLGDKWH